MRERTTWNREEVVKKAALMKTADPYTMNQEHPQPAADKYVTGDPSTFAEDVHKPNTWETEYSGDEVKRNEIGMPEMRSDTFNHSEKTAKEVLLKKADLCVAVARIMLAGIKTASEKAVENQAFSLMFMPDQALIATHKRLAGEQQDEGDDEDAGQDKQAQQDQDKDQDQDQAKQAQQDQDQGQDQGQEKQAALKTLASKVAASLQAGDYKRAQEQMQQLVQQQGQGQQQQVSQQQMQAQIQQMIQEAMGQMQAPAQQAQQQQAPAQQAPAQQAQQQQDPAQQAQQQMQSDEQTLDQMLAQDGCGPMAESDIQMETSPMDIGMDDLGPEDEALRTLFAQDDEQEVQQQQKQANVRTAATRTVGTRPTAGVAKLGGGSQGGGASVADLSSMWQSAPDVRDAFGLK